MHHHQPPSPQLHVPNLEPVCSLAVRATRARLVALRVDFARRQGMKRTQILLALTTPLLTTAVYASGHGPVFCAVHANEPRRRIQLRYELHGPVRRCWERKHVFAEP